MDVDVRAHLNVENGKTLFFLLNKAVSVILKLNEPPFVC